MRFGCCVNLGSFVPQAAREAGAATTSGTVFTALQYLKDTGFDFAECTVGLVMQPPGGSFAALQRVVGDSGLPVYAFNSFIPARLPLVGPRKNTAALRDYVLEACHRIAQLGGRILVLGSGAARRVPDQYSPSAAYAELSDFLRMTGDIAASFGITVVLEPLCQAEANLIHTVQEAVDLTQRVNHTSVASLADTYHMDAEGEPTEALIPLARYLRHVHVADTNRRAPGTGSYDFKRLRNCLEKGAYQGAISIECSWSDLRSEAPAALHTLHAAWSG